MRRFEDNEFNSMVYNVHVLANKKDILLKFRDLAPFYDVFYAKDLPEELDPDDVFRYICYMYDMGSPAQTIQELKKRKSWAMSMLNNEPPYSKAVDDMLRWKNKAVNRRVITFLMVAYGEDYSMWKYNLEKMHQAMEVEINFEGTDEKSSKDAVQAEKTKTDILSTVKKEAMQSKEAFLQGEKSRELEQDLVAFTLLDSLGIRMEEAVMKYETDQRRMDEEDRM
jgi:hypothetical protein